MSGNILPPELPRWIVRQGSSAAMLRRPDYVSAAARARYIGFDAPEVLRLIDPSEDWQAVWEAEKARAEGLPISAPPIGEAA